MTWWLICFGAIILVIFGKWYFSDAISRLRRTFTRQQRETLEMKGSLQDARQSHQDPLRLIKGKEMDISRMKKRVAEQQMELKGKINKAKSDAEKSTTRRDRR
jgi:Sec-independent protein translocase protein TatA